MSTSVDLRFYQAHNLPLADPRKAALHPEQRGNAVTKLMDVISGFEDCKAAAELLLMVDCPCLRSQMSRELLRRLAARRHNPDGARALWELVLQMSGDDAGDWVDAGALVLTALHDKLQLNMRDLPHEMLVKAKGFLADEAGRAARALVLFGDSLDVSSNESTLKLRAMPLGHT